MSIAVSVIVGPSRIQRLLSLGCGLALLGAACAVGLLVSARFPGAPWLALLLACSAAVLVRDGARRPKTHRIDISGTGDLRVTVQQDVGATEPMAAGPARLQPGSVAWPVLVLLRYAAPGSAEAGVIHVLPVWRDSVDPAAWRALVVALGVIGRRGGDAECGNIR